MNIEQDLQGIERYLCNKQVQTKEDENAVKYALQEIQRIRDYKYDDIRPDAWQFFTFLHESIKKDIDMFTSLHPDMLATWQIRVKARQALYDELQDFVGGVL